MDIFHSTEFKNLRFILKDGIIKSAPIKNIENSLLASLGIEGVWVSRNLYPGNNVFGSYFFRFNHETLVKNPVLPLGKINGSETFISLDESLASDVSSELGVLIDNDFNWLKLRRANIIIGSDVSVNMALDLDVCSSWTDRYRNHRRLSDGDVYSSKGRLLALLFAMQENVLDEIFYPKLSEFSYGLLRTLVGFESSFKKYQKSNIFDLSIFPDSIDCLLSGDYPGAKKSAVMVGGIYDIVELICHLLEVRFKKDISIDDVMGDYARGPYLATT